MKKIVIMPGGFHPFHAGHLALYTSAVQKYPDADVYVAASDNQKDRPFPFKVKEKLASVAGIPQGKFVQVKSPFRPEEITRRYNSSEDALIFVRSEKDINEQPKPGGTKKDGSPAYYQSYDEGNLKPFAETGYIDYLPTVEFADGITSATEIRNAWPKLDELGKIEMIKGMYPGSELNVPALKKLVQMLDSVLIGQLAEAFVDPDQSKQYWNHDAQKVGVGMMIDMPLTDTPNLNGRRQGYNEVEDTEILDEVAFLAPAVWSAARVAAPWLLKQGWKIVKGTSKVAVKNPKSAIAVGTGIAYKDEIEAVAEYLKGIGETIEPVLKYAKQYALPVMAVFALMYGGKKIIDMVTREEYNEGDVIHGNFGKSKKEVDLNDISMKEADAVIKKVGLNLNIIFNKDFDSKIYETLIDAYMNNIKGTADDSTMRGIISIYQKRGARAGELPADLHEGEERSIIRDAAIDALVNAFEGHEDEFESREAIEANIYTALSDLNVEDIVDPEMDHHGQRMGNFASGRVIDVVDSSSVIDEVMQQINYFDPLDDRNYVSESLNKIRGMIKETTDEQKSKSVDLHRKLFELFEEEKDNVIQLRGFGKETDKPIPDLNKVRAEKEREQERENNYYSERIEEQDQLLARLQRELLNAKQEFSELADAQLLPIEMLDTMESITKLIDYIENWSGSDDQNNFPFTEEMVDKLHIKSVQLKEYFGGTRDTSAPRVLRQQTPRLSPKSFWNKIDLSETADYIEEK